MGQLMRISTLFPWLVILAIFLPICLGENPCACMEECEGIGFPAQRVYGRADMRIRGKGDKGRCRSCRTACLGGGTKPVWWRGGRRRPPMRRPIYRRRSGNLPPSYYFTGRSVL